jgi:RNA polymerase sigma-70 factor (ECF subfamily)
MYTVLKHIATDRLRRRQLKAGDAQAEPAHARSCEDLLRLRTDCEGALRHLLSRTSLTEAAVILLRDVFEFEYAEIAPLLGKTEATCRQFLRRARMRTGRGRRRAMRKKVMCTGAGKRSQLETPHGSSA